MKRQTLLGIAFSVFAVNAFAATPAHTMIAADGSDRLQVNTVAAEGSDRLQGNTVAADGSVLSVVAARAFVRGLATAAKADAGAQQLATVELSHGGRLR